MLQTTTMPLSKGSLHSCTFKRIPDETRFHVVDPNVIQKVESSGKYILTYKEPDTTYLNIHELRKEMGSPNLDLCTEEIEEIPYLVSLSDRKIPITFFRIPNNLPSCLFMVAGILEAALWSYKINAVFLLSSLVQL